TVATVRRYVRTALESCGTAASIRVRSSTRGDGGPGGALSGGAAGGVGAGGSAGGGGEALSAGGASAGGPASAGCAAVSAAGADSGCAGCPVSAVPATGAAAAASPEAGGGGALRLASEAASCPSARGRSRR